MQIVICGAGKVGSTIIRSLFREYEMVLIDTQRAVLDKMQEKYDIQGIKGSASDPAILQKAQLTPETVFVSATGSDDTNMIACQMAKTLFGVRLTAARLRHESYFQDPWKTRLKEAIGVDVVLSPERDAVGAIMKSFQVLYAFDSCFFADQALLLVGLQVSAGSALVHHTLAALEDMGGRFSIRVIRLIRDFQAFIPDPRDSVLPNDALYFMAPAEDIPVIMKAWGYPQQASSKVIIIGSSLVGDALLEQLAGQYDLVVIDEGAEKIKHLALICPDALFIHGNPLDPDLLVEAGIREASYTIAVTPDDTMNILAALMARSYGVQHPLALVQRTGSLSSLFTLGIEKMVHPSQLVAAYLVQVLAQEYVISLYPLEGDQSGAVVEARVQPTSPLIGRFTDTLNQEDFRVIVVMRQGKLLWTPTALEAEDHVILTVLPSGYGRFQKLFRAKR